MTTQHDPHFQQHMSDPHDDAQSLTHFQAPRGRVLVFNQLGLHDQGPRLEITSQEMSRGTSYVQDRIARHVAEHLDTPIRATSLQVQFDPNIPHGSVRPRDAIWVGPSQVARFRVYLEGACPRAQETAQRRKQIKFWAFVNALGLVLAGLGFWVGELIGAVLAVLIFAIVVMTLNGR